MTNTESPASKKPVHWTVLHNYRLRAGSFVTALIVIATHVWGKGYGPVLWGLLALQFVVYPHFMYWRAARAKDPKKAELTNMLIDPALFGLWMAALKFPLLITFLLFITALVNNAVNSGVKGLIQCFVAIACGILISIPFFGWHVAPGNRLDYRMAEHDHWLGLFDRHRAACLWCQPKAAQHTHKAFRKS
ncbi:MAG: hypothetical protein IPH54_01515 [Rhodoferax sp.]|nr:hypothetical protein [Rhodoferax sp.]